MPQLAASSRRLLAGLGGLFFLLPIVGTWTTHGVPPTVKQLSTALIVLTLVRPQWGLSALAVLLPLNTLLRGFISPGYGGPALAEMVTAAFLFGTSARLALGWRPPASRLAPPALVLGTIVATSGVMGLIERQHATAWPLDYLHGLTD